MSINPKELKNEAYYLTQSNDHGVIALKELSAPEYKHATDASLKLHLYHYHTRREKEVKMNLDDFFEKYKYYETKSITRDYKDKDDFFDRAYIDLNRVTTNFLCSFRLFIDNIDIYFREEYGSDSYEYKTFKNTISYEFNSKFEYRFLYSLRNYSQHKGFPIGSVGMDYEVDPYSREVHSEFKVSFDKEKLLNADPKNFRHVELDLTLFHESFPVLPQMVKIKKSLDVVTNSFMLIEKKGIVEQSNILLKYLAFLEGKGQLGFARFRSKPKGNGSFESKELPIGILRQNYRDLEGKEPDF